MAKEKESLMKLYLHQLQDLYSAEEQILVALPKMIEKTTHAELKKGFQQHDQPTEQQKQRLEKIFSELGEEPGEETCKAMKGLIAEGNETMEEFKSSDVLVATSIAAPHRVEPYEMEGYGCARTYASLLWRT